MLPDDTTDENWNSALMDLEGGSEQGLGLSKKNQQPSPPQNQ
jgi:hypothetical protein